MEDTYSVSTIHWNGIEIEIRWSPDYIEYGDNRNTGHLEVESVAPARAPLPFGDTGYRSTFLPHSILGDHESIEDFVEQWLASSARSEHWRRADMKRRQLSLF